MITASTKGQTQAPVPCIPGTPLECPNEQAPFLWEPVLWPLLALAVAFAIICLIGWLLAARRVRRAETSAGRRRGMMQPAPSTAPSAVPTENDPHMPPAEQQQPASWQVIEELIALDDMVDSQATSSQINRILQTAGAQKDSPEPGAPFDPNLHTAVYAVSGDGDGDGDGPDTIVDVIRPGWRVGSTMIRPAEVSVRIRTAPPG